MTPQAAWIETGDGAVDVRPPAAPPRGHIYVVTDQPIEIDDSPMARAWAAFSRRPWIPPAVLLGLVETYLLLRNR